MIGDNEEKTNDIVLETNSFDENEIKELKRRIEDIKNGNGEEHDLIEG